MKELFLVFLQIGMCSFGGGYAVIPLIQQQVVNLRGWLTLQEFTNMITISQMTPGPLAVNTSTFVGLRIGGLGGAVAATFGCILAGGVVSLVLYQVFCRRGNSGWIAQVLRGLKAFSLGLIMAAGGTLLVLTFWDPGQKIRMPSVLLFAVSFLVLRKWKWHPVLLLTVTGVLGLVIQTL